MGFFLCVCTRVASLEEMEAKIFHSYGTGCARGCLTHIMVSRSVDIVMCRRASLCALHRPLTPHVRPLHCVVLTVFLGTFSL
jgi:hypothetical protein